MTGSNEIINQIIKAIDNACEFCEKDFSHDEIIEILKSGNDSEKQICLLKLNCIKNQEEADLLVFHITDHHGIIRESAANKINEFVLNKQYLNFFRNKYAADSFLKAINDVNPNICRTIIEILGTIFEDNALKNYFLENLYKRIDIVFDEIERLKKSNWYTKKIFNLYWCLETLGEINAPTDSNLISVLEKTCSFKEYTIREKSAFVLSKLDNSCQEITKLKENLKNDENFYVKRYSKKFI